LKSTQESLQANNRKVRRRSLLLDAPPELLLTLISHAHIACLLSLLPFVQLTRRSASMCERRSVSASA
jgi:hypothetical protein